MALKKNLFFNYFFCCFSTYIDYISNRSHLPDSNTGQLFDHKYDYANQSNRNYMANSRPDSLCYNNLAYIHHTVDSRHRIYNYIGRSFDRTSTPFQSSCLSFDTDSEWYLGRGIRTVYNRFLVILADRQNSLANIDHN